MYGGARRIFELVSGGATISPSGVFVPTPKLWLPEGAKAENLERKNISGALNLSLTSKKLQLCGGFELLAGVEYKTLTFLSGPTAANLPLNQWAALFTMPAAGGEPIRLAISADKAEEPWAKETSKTFIFEAAYTPATNLPVYAGILVNATTPPNLLAQKNEIALYTLPPVLTGTSTSGLTTPATCPEKVAALTPDEYLPYVRID